MDYEKHQQQVTRFFEGNNPELIGNLNEALYSLSELDLFEDDIDSVSEEQAFLMWRVIEKLRQQPFPDDLRM